MSDPIPFLSPRMVGQRFEQHSIPLEMLKDFAALEEMLIEVAKWHYLKDHPERKRTPKGFTDGVSLKLTGVEDGSAVPKIGLFVASAMLFPDENQFLLEKARDSVIAAINAAEHDEPIDPHLSEMHLAYFDRIGRGLREGEAIEFNPNNRDRPARLNKVTRRKLTLASTQIQELTEEVTLRGRIPEVDKEKLTFHLQLPEGNRVPASLESQHREKILEAFTGYDAGTRVLLQGIGRFNRQERLQRIESVEHLGLLDPNDVAARLDEFRSLQNGWLDGKGLAPAPAGLDWLTTSFENSYPDDLPLPYVYPTAEGGVQAEWTLGQHELSLEIDLRSHQGQWHVLDLLTQAVSSRDIHLDGVDDWTWLVQQIRPLAGGQP
ncbi:MAG: hypothetical protein O3C40_07025 [Planctomycetota bacterium]|nr:hypothetical protein [Planctomycetota bacterium]